VRERLEDEGHRSAAKALVIQAKLRSLPSHDKETLLVHATDRRGELLTRSCAPSLEDAAACWREPNPVQALFASNAQTIESVPHPTEVTALSSAAYKKDIPKYLSSKYEGTRYAHQWTGEAKIQKILRVQNPAAVSTFEVPCVDKGSKVLVPSSELLPGGSPILDHAIAFLSKQPEWEKTVDVLKRFSKLRVTSPDALPEIKELVIGSSSPSDFREAGDWIVAKHQETKDKYGFCLPALDVENLGLVFDSIDATWESIEYDLEMVGKVTGVVEGPGISGASRFSFPVLLMYGGVGWQLHLRIPVVYRKVNRTTYVDCFATSAEAKVVTELFQQFLPATGTGISHDIATFIRAVNVMNSISILTEEITVGIPLDGLIRLSGISHKLSSLVSMVFLTLGGVLAKEWECSVADHRWGEPLRTLSTGLRAYLAGDIQQVAVVASILSIIWVAHLVPDGKYIRTAALMDPLEFVSLWIDTVTKNELPWLQKCAPDHQAPLPATREELLLKIGITPNSGTTLVSLCPAWPAITSGGPRDTNVVQEFSRKAILLFSDLYSVRVPEQTWDTVEEPLANMSGVLPLLGHGSFSCPFCVKVFESRTTLKEHVAVCGEGEMDNGPEVSLPVPMDTSAPVVRDWTTDTGDEVVGSLFRHPSTREVADPYFEKDPSDLSAEGLREASARLGVFQKQVVVEYVCRDLERSVRLLDLVETEKEFGVRAFRLHQGTEIVEALRAYLFGKGRLRLRSSQWVDPWARSPQFDADRARRADELEQSCTQAQALLDKVKPRVTAAASSCPEVTPLPAPLAPLAPLPGHGMSRKAKKRRRIAEMNASGASATVAKEDGSESKKGRQRPSSPDDSLPAILRPSAERRSHSRQSSPVGLTHSVAESGTLPGHQPLLQEPTTSSEQERALIQQVEELAVSRREPAVAHVTPSTAVPCSPPSLGSQLSGRLRSPSSLCLCRHLLPHSLLCPCLHP